MPSLRALLVSTAMLLPLGIGSAAGAVRVEAEQDQDATVVSAGRQEQARPAEHQANRSYRVVLFLPACRGNDPNSAGSLDTSCAGALQMCSSTPDPADLMFWRFAATRTPAPTGTGGITSSWTSAGMLCLRRDRVPGTAVPAFTATDLARLPLPASRIQVQPAGRAVLCCNRDVPTNLFTTDTPATFDVRLLGTPITVHASPVSWTWAYGDATNATHTRPGGPYPDLSTAHTYTHPGTYTITLTTAWTGTYTLPGGPPIPIDGTATVTSLPATLTAIETRAHLVADPLP
jgi:hypothetical protein